MQTAHLFQIKARRFVLIIADGPRPVGAEYPLQATNMRAAKREAEAMASERGAKPWNF